jgi:hypothetical protein
MDWLKQSEEMVRAWSDTQQKMLTTWLDSMKGFMQPQAAGVWEKTLEAWERAIENMLESQAEWARMWAGSVTATKGVSKDVVESATQLKEMTERWTEFQQELWHSWFEMVHTLDWSKVAEGQDIPPVFRTWKTALTKAMDRQMEWVNAWLSDQAEPPAGG